MLPILVPRRKQTLPYDLRMEINLVVLNLGNSRLACANFISGELGEVTRIPHAERGQWEQLVGDAWKRVANRENAAIVAASVNPALEGELEDVVSKATNRDIVWVGKDLDLPIRVITENPGATGVDRVVTMAAAYEQIGKACIVVDAGTAVTVNCCNDNGDFLGGAIARRRDVAGLCSTSESRLPKIDFDIPNCLNRCN